MRPVEFTEEEIVQAGKELQASGRNITGFALRQVVGGGSASRLKQVWDEYIAGLVAGETEAVAELPQDVADEVSLVVNDLHERLMSFAVSLNDKAVKLADQKVVELTQESAREREEASRELADASRSLDEIEGRLEVANKQIADLEERLAEARETAHGKALELTQLRERLAILDENARQATERYTVELNAEKASREDAHAQRDAAREEVAELRGKMEVLKAHNTELMEALAKRGA